jgi:hypothetical protein
MILAQLWLILYAMLQISLIIQDPSKNSILNFLVVFLFKEVIMEKVHRTDQQ